MIWRLEGLLPYLKTGRGPPYRGYNPFSDIPLPIFAAPKSSKQKLIGQASTSHGSQAIHTMAATNWRTNKKCTQKRKKQTIQPVCCCGCGWLWLWWLLMLLLVVVIVFYLVVLHYIHHHLTCFPPLRVWASTKNNDMNAATWRMGSQDFVSVIRITPHVFQPWSSAIWKRSHNRIPWGTYDTMVINPENGRVYRFCKKWWELENVSSLKPGVILPIDSLFFLWGGRGGDFVQTSSPSQNFRTLMCYISNPITVFGNASTFFWCICFLFIFLRKTCFFSRWGRQHRWTSWSMFQGVEPSIRSKICGFLSSTKTTHRNVWVAQLFLKQLWYLVC